MVLWLHLVNRLSYKVMPDTAFASFQWFGRVVQMTGWALEGQILRFSEVSPSRTSASARTQRESSYADTLLALLIREGGSTSEHRNGLCAVAPVSHAYLGATASDLGSVGECEH